MKTKYINIIRIAILLLFCTICQTTNAQAPQKMSYQAVVRDVNDALIASTSIGMQVSILQGSLAGTVVYSETHLPLTNQNGLVSIEIGTGTIVTGTFSGINWANGPYFIKTEIDPSGGNQYTISSTNELMSVPYALFAANSIPGPAGPEGLQGANGIGISNTVDNNDGTISFHYNDGTIFTTSDLTGPQGPAGNTGPAGIDGIDGISPTIGPNGNWFIGTIDTGVYSTGPEGLQGANGIGISNTVDNNDGTISFHYNDGTIFTTSDLTGPQGPAGNTGPAGIDGIDGISPTIGPNGNWFIGTIDTGVYSTGPEGLQGLQGVVIVEDMPGYNGTPGTPGSGTPGAPGAGTTIVTNDTGTWVYNPATNGWRNINGVQSSTFLQKSANYTITSLDITNDLVLVNTSNSTIAITLPSATSAGVGKKINITGVTQNSLNLVSANGDSLIGTMIPAGTTNLFTALGSYVDHLSLISDGSNTWYIVGSIW